jgi:hypothetical protein
MGITIEKEKVTQMKVQMVVETPKKNEKERKKWAFLSKGHNAWI